MSVFKKIRNMDVDKRNRLLGMVIIFLAFIVIGYFIKTVFFNNASDMLPVQETETTENITKNEEPPEDEIQNKMTIADIDTDISYDIPEGIQQCIDVEAFDAAFKKYLEDNMLMTEKTRAESDGVLLTDFNNKYLSFDLRLNNYNSNTVTCVMLEDGTYDFSFY